MSTAGDYRCIVTNLSGAVTSSVATLMVVPPPLVFPAQGSSWFGMTPQGMQLSASGLADSGWLIVFASTNLVEWESIYTNGFGADTVYFVDSEATNYPMRFYRAMEFWP